MITRNKSPFSSLMNLDQTFEELLQAMFYTFPTESKPPMEVKVYKRDSPDDSPPESGIMIQMAVAGYKEDQLKVYSKNKTLIIEGDNTKSKNVPDKFKSNFKRILPCKETVSLDKTKVDLEDGILTVKVPFHQPEEEKVKSFF